VSKKTILIATDNTHDQINGVVTTYRNIAEYAFRDGYQFKFVDPECFPHIAAPGYDDVDLSWPWGISYVIDQINPDYIHIATEGPVGLATRMLADRRKWRYNTSYHTNFAEALRKLLWIPESLSWRYIRWFHRHSGRVLTTTQAMVETLQNHGVRGDIRPWTRGVDRSLFNPDLRRKLRDPEIKLLYVGRVSPEKNLIDFCELNYPNSVKTVVGDGPQLQSLKEKYNNIHFVGFKHGLDLARLYANADVFVFPSRWDTFGLVMIEAMSCGTPVAAYPVTGPNQVVEPGVTGYLDENLYHAVDQCLKLDRDLVSIASQKWSWKNAWEIFRDNLIEKV
jgi:glycosyltransferase involved in cell wall biosynthesis